MRPPIANEGREILVFFFVCSARSCGYGLTSWGFWNPSFLFDDAVDRVEEISIEPVPKGVNTFWDHRPPIRLISYFKRLSLARIGIA